MKKPSEVIVLADVRARSAAAGKKTLTVVGERPQGTDQACCNVHPFQKTELVDPKKAD